MKTSKMTSLALFTTLSIIIFTVEAAIPPLVPIPGIKLGLANIITLVVLHQFSAKDALLVLLMRIVLSGFFFGQAMSLLYSLAGGLLCFAVMALLNRLLGGHFLFLISMTGAVFHNIGQLAVAYFLTLVPGVFIYLPFLLAGGILTGIFTGLCAEFCCRFLPFPKAAAQYSAKSDDDNSAQAH